MPTRIFLDTSFVIALINVRDQFHDRAQALSRHFETTRLLTTDAALLEIGNALSRAFRTEAIATIKVIQDSERVEVIGVSGRLFEAGLVEYERHQDKSWSLVDCISFAVMREENVQLALTFDADFAQAGFVVVSG